MRIGLKKVFSKNNMVALKKGVNTFGKIAQKGGQIGSALAPALMLGGPEMAPVVAGLEVGSLAAQGVGSVLQTV